MANQVVTLLVAIIVSTSLPASAQSKREKLDGFGDLKFGTHIERAKSVLKVQKLEQDKASQKYYLEKAEKVGGMDFSVKYYFEKDKFNFVTLDLVEKQACRFKAFRIEGMIESKYGPASERDKDVVMTIGNWTFTDGASIIVTSVDGSSIGSKLECGLLVTYRQGGGGKSF